MSEGVRVRPAAAADRPAIAALLDAVLGPRPYAQRVRLWEWRAAGNPARPEGFPEFLVAESGGRIVGVHGLVPLPFAIGERTAVSACACDFAVAPDARGAGLALKLAAMAPALSPVALSTTANEAAGKLTLALKGAMLEAARVRWFRPLRIGGLASAKAGGRGALAGAVRAAARLPDAVLGRSGAARLRQRLRNGGVAAVSSFGAGFDALWERLRAAHPVGVVRDAAYLNWRYRDYPFGGVRAFAAPDERAPEALAVVQYGVAPDGLRLAALTELAFAPGAEAAGERVLTAALLAAQADGADYATAVAPAPGIERALRAARFQRRESPRSAYTWKANDAESRELLARPDAWLFSLGDGDASFFYPS